MIHVTTGFSLAKTCAREGEVREGPLMSGSVSCDNNNKVPVPVVSEIWICFSSEISGIRLKTTVPDFCHQPFTRSKQNNTCSEQDTS